MCKITHFQSKVTECLVRLEILKVRIHILVDYRVYCRLFCTEHTTCLHGQCLQIPIGWLDPATKGHFC